MKAPVMVFCEPERLDDKGRCCGRKPLVYKRSRGWDQRPGPYRFCTICDRAYEFDRPEQIANWAYEACEGGFLRRNPSSDKR